MGQRAAWFGAAVDRAVERIGRAASWLTLAIALLMAANVLLPSRIYGVVANYQWLAIPLFVFMGVMLEKSRLAEDLLDVFGHLAGGLRGGMALGAIDVGVRMGATTGIVGATVITLGLLTLQTLLRPSAMPPVPQAERDAVSRSQLWLRVVKVALPPLALALVLSVLGSIIGGVAAPTEAASMGALGSILVVAFARRLNLAVLREVMQGTMRLSAMVLFILICAQVFSAAFRGLQGEKLIEDLFASLPGGINADFWFLMALFFLRGVAPLEITTRHIYTGIVPFVLMQILGIVLVFFFPTIATWLPRAIGW